jgi:hypothetical protein
MPDGASVKEKQLLKENSMDVLSFSQMHKRLPTPIKENPLKATAATVAAAATIIGAILTVDARYAHAADIQKEALTQQKQITKIEADRLEDKVFELDMKKADKPKDWTPVDEAMLQRYKRRSLDIAEVQKSQAVAETKLKSKD